LNLPDPRVVLTDKEKALMNAIEAEFPFTKCMLCIWHVNKNILAKARAFSAEILFLYSEITIRILTSIEGKGEGNVGALDVGRLRGNFARYGGSLEEIPS